MTTKASNSVLNLVDPPIDELVLATPLAVSSGGIGTDEIAAGAVLVGSTTNPRTIVEANPDTAGLPLVSNGPGALPTFQTISGSAITGTRTKATGPTVVYCNFATGNDTTGDGTVGNPWQTIQHTFDTLNETLDAGGFDVTINQQAGGVDTSGLLCDKSIPGIEKLYLIANGGINTTNNAGIEIHHASIEVSGSGTIRGLNFDIAVNKSGFVALKDITLGACANTKLYSQFGGVALINGSYTDSGNAATHWTVDSGGQISVYPASTITLSGTPAYSVAFARASADGVIIATLATFSGSATGIRFICELAGGIFTNSQGLTFLPGNAAGTITSPGWYDFETAFEDTISINHLIYQGVEVNLTTLDTATDFYVATTGSDSNPGTISQPWQTLQHAWDALTLIDLNGNNIIIHVADGTYAPLNANSVMSGQASIESVVIEGNVSNPAACIISATLDDCVQALFGARFVLRGFRLTATGTGINQGTGIQTNSGATVYFNNIDFAVCDNAHINGGSSGYVAGFTQYSISGGSQYHVVGDQHGIGQISEGCAVTLTGTPNFSGAFALAIHGGLVTVGATLNGVTFNGAAIAPPGSATGNRFIAQRGGGIIGFDIDRLPGSINSTPDAGSYGWYA